jgi:hypothetical protein
MFFRDRADAMRWENLLNIFRSSDGKDEVRTIEPRPLTECEVGWIRDILRVNAEWRDANIDQTQVVAEGQRHEGISIVLRAPGPENPNAPKSMRESVGELWIQLDDGSTINVQLTQFEGWLREIYVLFIDPKHPKRKLPGSWIEVSRETANV